MVVYCGVHRVTTPAVVTSIGTGSNDGWQIVARLPSSELPNLPGQYVFHVFGRFGALSTSGATPNNGLVQIRLGSDAGTIHPGYVAQVGLREPFTGAAAAPFGFLVMVNSQVSDTLWGSSWSGSSDLCVWARVFTNGDPLQYAAQFSVGDVTFVWWDVASIPSGKRQSYSVDLNELRVGAPGADTTMSTLTGAPAIGAPGELWLHFYELQWLPWADGAGAASQIELGYYTNGFTSFWTTKVGNEQFGCLPRGPLAGILPAPEFGRQGWSGFFAVNHPTSDVRVSLRSRNRSPGAGSISTMRRLRYFSVRVDDLPQFAIAQSNSWGSLLGPNGDDSVLYPLEPTFTQVLQPMVLYCCTATTPSPVWMQHSWHLRTNDGRDLVIPHLRNQVRAGREGLQDFCVSRQGMVPRSFALRYEGLQWTDPSFPLQVRGNARDVVAVQFLPDTEPDLLPPVVPGAGAPIVIVPGRESLDVGALPDLPLQPDGAVTQTPLDPEPERLVGVSGVVRTWPMFTKPRWQLGLVWSRVTKAQADTLLAFLRANPTFRYRRPRGGALEACVVTEQPSVTGHVVFSVSVQVATLVHTGP